MVTRFRAEMSGPGIYDGEQIWLTSLAGLWPPAFFYHPVSAHVNILSMDNGEPPEMTLYVIQFDLSYYRSEDQVFVYRAHE